MGVDYQAAASKVGTVRPLTDTEKRAASLIVCAHARDTTDARHILDVLGLLP